MFERGKDIREAKKAEILKRAWEKGFQQGIQYERQRIREALESRGVKLPPDIAAAVFGDVPPTARKAARRGFPL